jgi:hypothetical protein
MGHGQLQEVDALGDVLDRKIKIFRRPLQEIIHFVYMRLQNLDHLFI